MRRWTSKVLCVLTVLSLMTILSCTPADNNASSYGEDRAQIENLQARYMFGLDFSDPDIFPLTFTEDGVLDIVGMQWQGREEIKKLIESRATPAGEENPDIQETPDGEEEKALYPATGRHNITNIVLKIDGDKAVGRAYWFHMGNDNPERKAVLSSYGYYEDELAKVDGQWLFTKRVIYNEQEAEWIGSDKNPSW